MSLDVGNTDAKTLGGWILNAGAAVAFYFGMDKLLRSGPIRELKKRVDNLEKGVETKFNELASQRTLDVSNLRSDMASQNVELAKITVLLAAQTKAFDSFVARIDEAADKRHHR